MKEVDFVQKVLDERYGPPKWKPTARDRRLMILYGITEAEYNKILSVQGNACAICRRPPVTVALGTDHDHKREETRGLLCLRCNKGLSLFGDDSEILERAAEYMCLYPSQIALGFIPKARAGRSTRKWRTKKEKRERMAFVNLRFKEISDGESEA